MELSFPSEAKKNIAKICSRAVISYLMVTCAITLRLFLGPRLDSCSLILTMHLDLFSKSLKELCLGAVPYLLTTTAAVFS